METNPDIKEKSIGDMRRAMKRGRWPWHVVEGKDMCPDCWEDRKRAALAGGKEGGR